MTNKLLAKLNKVKVIHGALYGIEVNFKKMQHQP